MNLLLIVMGVVFLAVPGALAARLGPVAPGRWARFCRASLTVGSGLVVTGLALWGVPALMHVVDGTGIGAFCDGAVHALPLGGVYIATAMLIVAGIVGAGLLRAANVAVRGLRDARIDPYIGRHRRVAEFDVVVVPSTRLLACAVTGPEPQIVLSDALIGQLEPEQVRAVVRHEMAHHRLRHRQYLVLASAIDRVLGWAPFVRSSTRSLREALEHWADEVSTAGSPQQVECLRSALTRIGAVDGTTPVRAAVGRRLGRLDRSHRAEDALAWPFYLGAVVVSLAAVSALTLASVAQLVAVFGHCPA